ncbi:hypothetical protein AAY473_026764 [Plecturocebus cupreus]
MSSPPKDPLTTVNSVKPSDNVNPRHLSVVVETGSHSVTQAGVQWCNHSSLYPWLPRLKSDDKKTQHSNLSSEDSQHLLSPSQTQHCLRLLLELARPQLCTPQCSHGFRKRTAKPRALLTTCQEDICRQRQDGSYQAAERYSAPITKALGEAFSSGIRTRPGYKEVALASGSP